VTEWTREALPDGAMLVFAACGTCGLDTLTWIDNELVATTRSARPSATGAYLVQPHHDWCPVWTGIEPELPCPQCGAPVWSWDWQPGYSLRIPGPPLLGGGHIVGPAEVVFGHPAARSVPLSSAKRAPDFDELTVFPCRHVLKGLEGNTVLTRAGALKRAAREWDDQMVLAAAGPLLAAAETAGHAVLADAYRQAVHERTGEMSGLLATLRLLHPAAAQASALVS
jgi:hypothetical protein